MSFRSASTTYYLQNHFDKDMHDPFMLSYHILYASLYVSIFLGLLHNICVRTVVRCHRVVGAASPIQLKPWTKPDLEQVGMT